MAIKILIGGSPCTYWSIAKKSGRETEASGMGWELFKNYLIAKEKFKPDFFLYENNKSASQAIKDQIGEELGVGVDPDVRFTYINSSLVSAQNRQRFYVTNFGDIEQPEDRGILLKDILESGVGQRSQEKSRTITAGYVMCSQRDMRMDIETDGFMGKQGVIEPVNTTEVGKSIALKAQYYKDNVSNFVVHAGAYGYKSSGVAELVRIPDYGKDDKARPVNASYAHKSDGEAGLKADCFPDNPNKQVFDFVAEPIRVGALPRPNGELSTSQVMRVYSVDGKNVTQSAGGGGMGGKTGLYALPVEFEKGIPTKAISYADGKTYIVYEVKDGQITIKGNQYPIKLKDGYYIIRKLTVRECARLQTMPDDYCKAVSDSQAYKALGNGWTAEVIIHLLNHALKDVPRGEEIVVLSMYDGIATGRYCLDKMGFTNVKYHAYEIDKYPIMVAMDNYPDIIQHGDAFAVREDDWQPPQTRSQWLDELLGGD